MGWGTVASVCLLGNFIMEGFISLRAQNLHKNLLCYSPTKVDDFFRSSLICLCS